MEEEALLAINKNHSRKIYLAFYRLRLGSVPAAVTRSPDSPPGPLPSHR